MEEIIQQPTIDKLAYYKNLMYKSLTLWKWFAISVFIFLVISVIAVKLTPPSYQSGATVLVQSEESGKGNISDFLGGLQLFSKSKNIDNEIRILKSSDLMANTIAKNAYYINYYQTSFFVPRDIYTLSPFKVILNKEANQLVDIYFEITIKDATSFDIKVKGEDISLYNYLTQEEIAIVNEFSMKRHARFGERIQGSYYDFVIEKSDSFNFSKIKNPDYLFKLKDVITYADEYVSKLAVSKISKDATLLELSIVEENPVKAVDFLNSLTELYIERELSKKNRIADSTIGFINKQLYEITDSLKTAEKVLQNFRMKNKVLNLTFQAQKIYSKMQDLEAKKAVAMIQRKYFFYLKESVETKREIDNLMVPSTMGIQDPMLNNLVGNLTKLITERKSAKYNVKEKNPYLQVLDAQILNTVAGLKENINSLISSSDIYLKEMDSQLNQLVEETEKLPKTERELFTIERKFKFNNTMFTFLMQKRSESQILKASNLPDNEIIDQARLTSPYPISPKKKASILIGLLLGLAFPLLYIIGRDYLLDKIETDEDIKYITHYPIIGRIVATQRKGNILVKESTRSHISECFRSLRTNLKFFNPEHTQQTILLTSTYSGEGKTFCAINLAAIFALSGKKTLLMGFDLRKPRIYDDANLREDIGLSSYLIGQCSYDEIIQSSSLDNLDIIVAGLTPPNPSELVESDRTISLFEHAKKEYDVIIVDTPPIGIVADPLSLIKFSDLNIFVIRQDYTSKRAFKNAIGELEINKIQHLHLLYNNVDFEKSGIKSGYGYYDEEAKKSSNILTKLFWGR